MSLPRIRRNRGFTLIEVAIVAAIVAILASVALPLAELTAQRNREAELRTSLRQIREGIDAYKRSWDAGKIAKSPMDSGYPRRLDDLVEGVEDITVPTRTRIYFLRRLPRDPFGNNQGSAAESWGKRSYQSPPDSPASGSDVYDVFSLSSRVGLNGVPYRQW